MIGLIQRASAASVSINNQEVAKISTGILALIGIEKGDSEAQHERMLERLLGYRIFPDDEGRMNLGLTDIQGELLLVPQFTLAADTRKGMRPGFSTAAAPDQGKQLFERFCTYAASQYPAVQTGVFGADMQVQLINDGPVTFWLQV